MSFNVAILEAMQAEGLDLDACIRVLKAGEKKADPTAAERQRACRARKASRRDVTRDPPNESILTPEPEEANASLVKPTAQKAAVAWPCPEGVDPRHWADFLANRKRKRCVSTQTALDGVLDDIARFADAEWPPGRLVQHAAAKGWASINDPRKPFQNDRQQQPSIGKTTSAVQRLGGVRDCAPM